MAKEPKMKIGIGADTGDFEKGSRKVKQEMKDLNKVSSDAFAAIGNALGVDVGKVRQFTSALSGLGNKFAQTGQAGTSAFGSIAKAITPIAAGVAGLGLGAAVVAFKQLNAEADAFERTIQGGAIKAQTDAYAATMRQAIRDQMGIGQQASSWRQDLKTAFTNLAGWVQSGFDSEVTLKGIQAGERAKELAAELYDIDLQRKENSVKISELDAQIAQKREIISDTTMTTAERAAALADAQQLIKDKLDLQLPLAERERDLVVEYNGLASTTIKEYEHEIAAKIQVNNLIQQEAAEQRQLLRQQTSINRELEKEKELRETIAASRASLAEWSAMAGGLSGISSGATVQVPASLIVANRKEFVEEITDLSKEVESIMTRAFSSVGEVLGELIGNMVTGGDAWGNFTDAALSAFGDLAISVGNIAIATGVASEEIKAALALNGWGAIAAGVALVALGHAVKAGLANVANGNYSSSAGVATSGNYSAATSDYIQREVYVNVTGTLQADGNQLIAVINNTNRYNTVTT